MTYAARLHNHGIIAYKLNVQEVNEIVNLMWTSTYIEAIRKQFIGDASNTVLGLQWFYGLNNIIKTQDETWNLRLGNVRYAMNKEYKVTYIEWVHLTVGSVRWRNSDDGDCWDYMNSSAKVYLPFVGVVDLDLRDVLGHTLTLIYHINILDGSAVCELKNEMWGELSTATVFSAPCQWGYDIPIAIKPPRDPLSATLRAATGGLFNGEGPSYTAGSLTPNTGVMTDMVPKLYTYLNGQVGSPAGGEGWPSAATLKVGEASGYLKVRAVYGESTLPARHSGQIVQMLKEGVYL